MKIILSFIGILIIAITLAGCDRDQNDPPLPDHLRKLSKEDVEALYATLPAPVPLSHALLKEGTQAIFHWFRDFEEWTNRVVSLDGKAFYMDKEARSAVVDTLNQFYTTEISRHYFDQFFNEIEDGYEFLAQGRMGSLRLLREGLEVTVTEDQEHVVIAITGFWMDVIDAQTQVKVDIEEQYELLKSDSLKVHSVFRLHH